VIVVFAVPLLDKLKIDDVVGAIPVHLLAGIWGTFIVPLSNGATCPTAPRSSVSCLSACSPSWCRASSGSSSSRPSASVPGRAEMMGLDKAEVGVEAYPEFKLRLLD
jgi:Amt family ammonium transporter